MAQSEAEPGRFFAKQPPSRERFFIETRIIPCAHPDCGRGRSIAKAVIYSDTL